MFEFGKVLVIAGVGFVIVGALVLLLGKSGFRGLPGDISYRGDHVSFYFPIVTCIVLSILVTALLWLWRWLSGR